MTWDQDQVDSFMKSYNWTNFEQKSCRMSTSSVPCLSFKNKKVGTMPTIRTIPYIRQWRVETSLHSVIYITFD